MHILRRISIFSVAILLSIYFFFPENRAVTYEFSWGRFGDNLLSYLHAKWLSHHYHIPLVNKPFEYSSSLNIDEADASPSKEYKRLRRVTKKRIIGRKNLFKPTLYSCRYFPEDHWGLSNEKWHDFKVDWKDPKFREAALNAIRPKEPLHLVAPPDGPISVAIHVREGGGYDAAVVPLGFPLKLPPLNFYLKGLEEIVRLFPNKPLYCHLFTDAKNPEQIAAGFQKKFPNIEFHYRKENGHDQNVLEDFFSFFNFDVLIRPLSNFSIVPSLLHDFAVVYSPKTGHVEKGEIYIDEVNIEINQPLYSELNQKPSLVFVHIGKKLPDYLPYAIEQAKIFNPGCPIYVLGNQKALKKLSPDLCTPIAIESIPKSKDHKKFLKTSRSDKGFWTVTTERFFYLESFMKAKNLSHVFHLESDVMLYSDLEQILPVFKRHYPNQIGATFDNDDRCIAGLVYIPNAKPLTQFVQYVSTVAKRGWNDMQLLAKFQKEHHQSIDLLPIIMPKYAQDHELVSLNGCRGTANYSHHVDEFQSIFDAAAIGQYLGGIDPIHRKDSIGFINESCIFKPSHFKYQWERDSQGRKVPFVIYNGTKCKLNNLHVHCKNLRAFASFPHPPKRSPSYPYVSGDTFRSISDFIYDELETFNPASVTKNSKVFVKGDYLQSFFETIHPKITQPYILITHNSDAPAPASFAYYLQDPKIIAWFTQNCDAVHPKLHPIPIGLANTCWKHGNFHLLEKIKAERLEKKHLAYMNLVINTFSDERKPVFDYFSKAPFCTAQSNRPYETYLKDLASSSFTISPRGNGLDTHRLWESLYLGSIPIVKSSPLDPLYADLPVLIVKEWEEVTESLLKKKLEEIGQQSHRFEKLYMPYWIKKIDSCKICPH